MRVLQLAVFALAAAARAATIPCMATVPVTVSGNSGYTAQCGGLTIGHFSTAYVHGFLDDDFASTAADTSGRMQLVGAFLVNAGQQNEFVRLLFDFNAVDSGPPLPYAPEEFGNQATMGFNFQVIGGPVSLSIAFLPETVDFAQMTLCRNAVAGPPDSWIACNTGPAPDHREAYAAFAEYAPYGPPIERARDAIGEDAGFAGFALSLRQADAFSDPGPAQIARIYTFVTGTNTLTVDLHPIPEPGTFALLGTGLLGLALWCRQRAKAG